MFSDETKVEAVTERAQFVRRRRNERFSETCVLKTVKHPPSVMLWSCITSEGPGPLYYCEGTMDQRQYKRVLEEVLLPHINDLDPNEGPYTFMHDSAPCHKAKSVRNFLDSVNLAVLPWPGNSPDLNAIENVWNVLKSVVYSRENKTIAQLKANIEDVWQNDPKIKHSISACIDSMPKRIKDVIKARGGITRY